MIQRFIFLIFVIGACPVINYAQEIWYEGYIIHIENDTLYGQIKMLGYEEMSKKAIFQGHNSKDIITYYPSDIKLYAIPGKNMYISKLLENGEALFLEYIVDGELDLLYVKSKNQDRFFIQKDSLPLKEVKYVKEIRTIDGVNYNYESKTHQGLLSLYTHDAPELNSTILKLKPDFEGLKKFTVKYHNQICKSQKCITYQNSELYTIFEAGPHLGIISINFDQESEYSNSKLFGYGIYFRIKSPRVSKYLSFRTGAIFTNFKPIKSRDKIVAKIPMHFEFILPNSSIIQPKVSIGANFYTNSIVYFGASIGFDVVLAENIKLSMTVEREILQIIENLSGNMVYSPMLGTYLKF